MAVGNSGKVEHRSRFDVLADVSDDNGIGTEQTHHEAADLAQAQISSQVQRIQLVNRLSRNHPPRQEPEW
ncbi:hypothetical protein V6N12_018611 [Hibiscus sabdariffa]|uniref:Uncharacterized protein n=1 Tax=Hibiscus sabdariffa TaxID=183260 RepID=A0ABR2AL08_9ROSI